MKERWRDIPGYGGVYQVSDHYQVRSFKHRMFERGRCRAQWIVDFNRPPVPLKIVSRHYAHGTVTLSQDGKIRTFGMRGLVECVFGKK